MATDLENLQNRIRLGELSSDPDWMLQVGLGDIEHEQFMYDQMRYGDPAELPERQRKELLESMGMSSKWDDLADYDELGIMGLRKHAAQGPLRYFDTSPYNIGKYETTPYQGRDYGQWDRFTGEHQKNYLAQTIYDRGDQTDYKGNLMDINLDELTDTWKPDKGSLQDWISNAYRHEYKHPLFPKGVVNYASRKSNIDSPDHAAIHATGALYGKSRQGVEDSFRTMNMAPRGAGKVAGAMTQWARDQNPHLREKYNTGGLVSLVL